MSLSQEWAIAKAVADFNQNKREQQEKLELDAMRYRHLRNPANKSFANFYLDDLDAEIDADIQSQQEATE